MFSSIKKSNNGIFARKKPHFLWKLQKMHLLNPPKMNLAPPVEHLFLNTYDIDSTFIAFMALKAPNFFSVSVSVGGQYRSVKGAYWKMSWWIPTNTHPPVPMCASNSLRDQPYKSSHPNTSFQTFFGAFGSFLLKNFQFLSLFCACSTISRLAEK